MSHASFAPLVAVIAIACLAPVPAAGQNQGRSGVDGAATMISM